MADVKETAVIDTAPAKPKVVTVPRPTPDQLQFLQRTNLRPGQYDRKVVVGGPSRLRRPTV